MYITHLPLGEEIHLTLFDQWIWTFNSTRGVKCRLPKLSADHQSPLYRVLHHWSEATSWATWSPWMMQSQACERLYLPPCLFKVDLCHLMLMASFMPLQCQFSSWSIKLYSLSIWCFSLCMWVAMMDLSMLLLLWCSGNLSLNCLTEEAALTRLGPYHPWGPGGVVSCLWPMIMVTGGQPKAWVSEILFL